MSVLRSASSQRHRHEALNDNIFLNNCLVKHTKPHPDTVVYALLPWAGGARRDEEKARAKERFFSHRDDFGQWNPKNQRPELWNLFNGRKNMGEHFRVFPISNWTEMDVWQYILAENIELPSLYYSHEREVFWRNGTWISTGPYVQLKPTDQPIKKIPGCAIHVVRF